MYSVAIFTPSRPSLKVRTLRRLQLNVDLYMYRSQRIWQAHQCSVYQQTPHQSLHLSFLILLQSYTLEIRHLMACFGRVFHENVACTSSVWIAWVTPNLVARSWHTTTAIRMTIVSPSSGKATVCPSTESLTCLLYLVSRWFDPCSQ